MGCYCSEIRRGNRELTSLRNIRSMIAGLLANDNYIRQDLSNLAKCCESAFITDHMSLLYQAFSQRNQAIAGELEDMEGDISYQIGNLESRISNWESMDYWYHESEDDD